MIHDPLPPDCYMVILHSRVSDVSGKVCYKHLLSLGSSEYSMVPEPHNYF